MNEPTLKQDSWTGGVLQHVQVLRCFDAAGRQLGELDTEVLEETLRQEPTLLCAVVYPRLRPTALTLWVIVTVNGQEYFCAVVSRVSHSASECHVLIAASSEQYLVSLQNLPSLQYNAKRDVFLPEQ